MPGRKIGYPFVEQTCREVDMRKPFLVAYDVTDPKRLQSVRLAITDWAHGGQKSVWECWATESREMIAAVQGGLDPHFDRLAFLRPEFSQSRCLGMATFSEDNRLIFIG